MDKKFTLSSVEFAEILKERLSSDTDVSLVVTGNSMLPFLADKRDKVSLVAFSGNAEKGDILFYKRDNGKCVLHRVVKTDAEGIYFAGDAQNYIEGPISPVNVLAECNEAVRKGKTVTKKCFIWWFFSHLWLKIIPLRPATIKFIGKIKNSHK